MLFSYRSMGTSMSPLRPLDLYTVRIVSRARSKLSNNTNFDNVALNANFITSAHDLLSIDKCENVASTTVAQ